jgi:hypothetical protein
MRAAMILRVLAAIALLPTLLASWACAGGGETLVITRGGTYTGSYEQVVVNTPEPVVIEKAVIRGSADLIVSHYRRAALIVRDTRGIGVRPREAGRSMGRFASIEGFSRVTIENCSIEGTGGIYLLDHDGGRASGDAEAAVRIVANRARNIDGRKSDGKGGWLADDPALVQFAQLDKVRGGGMEIAWNDVINEPDQSRVEDVISVYLSAGTKDSPLRIHDNFVCGAYPAPAATAAFSGGGIMLADGLAKDGPAGDPAFVHAFDNHVLDTVNYGIAISAGHDCQVYRNRVLSTGLMPDGRTKIAAQNVGIYVWDSYKGGAKRFYSNAARDNLVGWVNHKPSRNDWWRPDAAGWQDNRRWPDPVAGDAYARERALWEEKCRAAGITVGPRR